MLNIMCHKLYIGTAFLDKMQVSTTAKHKRIRKLRNQNRTHSAADIVEVAICVKYKI